MAEIYKPIHQRKIASVSSRASLALHRHRRSLYGGLAASLLYGGHQSRATSVIFSPLLLECRRRVGVLLHHANAINGTS